MLYWAHTSCKDLSSEEGNFPSLNNLCTWTLERYLMIWSPVDVAVMNGKYFPGKVACIRFNYFVQQILNPPSLSCCHFLLCTPLIFQMPPPPYCPQVIIAQSLMSDAQISLLRRFSSYFQTTWEASPTPQGCTPWPGCSKAG